MGVLEDYIRFILTYTSDHIFPVILIEDLINKDGDPTTPYKLTTDMKPSILHLRVLFCPCVVHKYTAHVGKKTWNIRHQAQKGFVGIPQHQKGYLVYVSQKQNILYSYNVVFYDIFSSVLAYKSQPYEEAMAMIPSV